MTFTPEQIAFIDKMIADRLLQLKVKTATVKDHHSLPEIRLLIMTHIEAMGCPIESTGKPRKYRFTESPQHSLFSQQQ
jgi:hypothetical protein